MRRSEREVGIVLGASGGGGEAAASRSDGKLKVYTLLNADLPTDDAPARQVCRAAKASRIPEATGAMVVDAGDALLSRC